MNRKLTIREISLRWQKELKDQSELSFWLIGDLLDDFRHRSNTLAEKEALLYDAPVTITDESHSSCNAYLAAVAETLCREVGLPVPSWTESRQCFLDRPWFAGGLETLKALLLAESPVPFRRRNLFVSANALSRV